MKRIKVGDLQFSDLFRTDIEKGQVFFNQRRAIIFDVEAMGTLRHQLIGTLGEELAMGVLTRFGYSQGFSDASMLGRNFDWETEIDWLAAGPVLHKMEGIVHVDPRKIEFDRQTGAFHMHGVWLNSYEAEVHLERCGLSAHPVCWTLTGYASGYATRFFGRDLLALETECAGKGDGRCYWEIRPVDKWGPEASPYLKALKAIDVSSQIKRLQTDEARFRDVAFGSADWVWETDAEGRYTYCSEHATYVFGISTEEILGRNFTGFMTRDEADRNARIFFEAAMRKQPIVDLESRYLNKDGSEMVFLTNSIPVLDDGGNLLGYRGIGKDITERKRAEEERRILERQMQQAQKMESLGVLAGGIAHDFNNLLMVVLGNAEMALKEISPMSAARGSLSEISIAAHQAAELCRQMLVYAGRASFTLERVGLRELVEEMAHLLHSAISKKAVLNLHMERGLPPIQADPSQIRQIVMNLIFNASEAIGDRNGVITVSVGATRCSKERPGKTGQGEDLAPGMYVQLEVTDTGCGMDADTRSRIFEPFFSTKFTGRGLGLASVLGIVKGHKGALDVHSEPGKGTTFKVLFPALEEAGKGVRTDASVSPTVWRGKGTILLVDDEESLLALGARMLEHLGFNVLTAADGLKAVDLYRERGKEIDLVLMDLTMPHMDGAEAFGELRRLNPDVRVVVASGYSPEDVTSRFAGKGLAGVLQKPYVLAKLRETFAGLMPTRSNEKE